MNKFDMVGATPVEEGDVGMLHDQARGFGASPDFLADVLQKYGPDVLSTVTEALRNGFSVSFIMETFRLLGPFVLDFLISVLSKQKMIANLKEQQVVGAIDLDKELFDAMIRDSELDKMSSSMIKVVVEKLIPYIFQKYGPQILEAVLKAIENAIDEGTN